MLIKNSPQQVIQTLLNHQQFGKKRELPDTPFETNASHKKRKGSTETSSSPQETQAIDTEMEEAFIPVENLNEEPIIAMVRDDEILEAFSPDNEFISFHTSQDESSDKTVFNECSIGESSGDMDLEQVVFEGLKDDVDDDKKNLNAQKDHINTKNDVQDEKDTLKDTYLQISENVGVMSDVVHLQVGTAATLKEDNTDNSDVIDDSYDGDDEFYDSQEDFDGNVEDGVILKKEEQVYARLSDDDEDNETEREPLPTSSHYDGYAFGEVYFPQVIDDVHPLSPRFGNTDFTYHSEASFTDAYDEEDYMDEAPRYNSIQEADAAQDDYVMDQRDVLIQLVSEMFLQLFGKEMVDLDLLQRSQLHQVGNYCWESQDPHLMLFMLKFLSKEFMHEECVYLGRELLNLEELTGEDLEECLKIYRRSYLKAPEHVQASEPLNPFNEITKEQIERWREEYYKKSNY